MLKLARNVMLIHVVVFSKVEFKFSTRDQQQIIDIEVGISQVQKLLQRLTHYPDSEPTTLCSLSLMLCP
jgi:hypothetical protein